jgi:hypothetical protein
MEYTKIGDHKATILKKVLADGRIKVYRDAVDAVEKTEISLPEGKVIINKDYEKVARLSRFKKIDIYSNEDTLLESIDIETEESMVHSYRFYLRSSPIGRGFGDIATCIANAFVEGSLDPRYLQGSSVDEEVITTIKSILTGKRTGA